MITLHETRLQNGLKILYYHAPDDPTFKIIMNVGVGARDETSNFRGICHFLEHAMFKGSGRFPDSISLSREMGKFGGCANGETNYEHHQFDFDGDADHLFPALDLFADFFFTPQFSDLDKEKEVVLEELYGYTAEEDAAFEGIRSLFPGQRIVREICGTEETVKSFTKEDLKTWRARYYSPENCVLAVSGKHLPAEVFQKLKIFGGTWDYLRNPVSRKDLLSRRGTPKPKKREINLLHSPDDQFSGALTFAILHPTSQDQVSLALLSDILDDDDVCSRLQACIREEGLVYDIQVNFDCLSDVMAINILWDVSEEKLIPVCQTLAKELLSLTKGEISTQDFDYYRQRRLFKNKVANHRLEDRLEHDLTVERIPYLVPIEEESKRLQTLTPDSVAKVLQKTIVGPTAWTILGDRPKRFRKKIERIA